MMKKFLFILFAFTLCLCAVNLEQPKVEASTNQVGELVSSTTEYFEDGSYLVTETHTTKENTNARGVKTQVIHDKTVIYYSATDKELWRYVLYGYFMYEEGVSCYVTASKYEQSISGSGWSFSNGNSHFGGNKAYGTGTFKFKLLGITTKTVDIDIHIECDTYGNQVD